jgi:hypothetical protein
MRAFLAALLIAFSAVSFAAELTIATFNTEFLTRPKIHVKFGFPLDLEEPSDVATWAAPGFRDQKFAEGAAAVAKVVAGINADVMVLTEVGNQRDVQELNAAIAAQGVDYPHAEVCACTDTAARCSTLEVPPDGRVARHSRARGLFPGIGRCGFGR